MNVQFWKGGGYNTNCDSILKFGRFISQLSELKINFILTKAIVTQFMCYFHCWLLVLYHSGVLFWLRIVLLVRYHILFGVLSVTVFIYTCLFRPETLQALVSVLNIICFYLWIQHTILSDICFLSLKICRCSRKNNLTALFLRLVWYLLIHKNFRTSLKLLKTYEIFNWGYISLLFMRFEVLTEVLCWWRLKTLANSHVCMVLGWASTEVVDSDHVPKICVVYIFFKFRISL